MNKIILSFFLVIVTTFFMFSCGQKKDGAITINILTKYGDESPHTLFFNDKIAEFNEINKDKIIVIHEGISAEDRYLEKLRTSFASGKPPHIFIEFGGARLFDYVEAGTLLDLKPYMDADKEWEDSFLPVFDKWIYKDYPGLWGLPIKMYAVVLYYNKDMFAKYNLNPPKDFKEFLQVCEVFKKNGVQPLMPAGKEISRIGHFHNNVTIKSLGIDAVEKLGDRTLAYDSPQMIETYRVIKEFIDKGYFGANAVGVDYPSESTAFLEGKVPMKWDGSWFLGQVIANKDAEKRTDIVPFPYIKEEHKGAFQGGANDGLSVAKYSEKENEASVQLVKFLSSQKFYAEAEYLGTEPIWPVVVKEPDPRTKMHPLDAKMKDIVANATGFRDDIQTYDKSSHMIDTVRNALQGLFLKKTPEETGADIVKKIKDNE